MNPRLICLQPSTLGRTEMSKRKITWKLTALLAIIAAVAVWSVSASRATESTPSARTLDNLNLGPEIQTLQGNNNACRALTKHLTELHNKTSLTKSEFTSLNSRASDVKQRLGQAQQAIKSAILKLKTAKRWDGLDEEVLAGVTNQKIITAFRAHGGARQILLDVSQTNIGEAASQIDKAVERFHLKVLTGVREPNFGRGAQIFGFSAVRVAYEPAAAPARSVSIAICKNVDAEFALDAANHGGHHTQAATDRWINSGCDSPTSDPWAEP
jgi:hypothetical protein